MLGEGSESYRFQHLAEENLRDTVAPKVPTGVLTLGAILVPRGYANDP
jgi:hypothetical protein